MMLKCIVLIVLTLSFHVKLVYQIVVIMYMYLLGIPSYL